MQEDKYFYIYTLEDNTVKITPHRYNPRGVYPDRYFDCVDAWDRMFGRTPDKSSLFLELYKEKLYSQIDDKLSQINKLYDEINAKTQIINNIDNLLEEGETLWI